MLRTGNFGGGKDWFSGRVRNIPKNATINPPKDGDENINTLNNNTLGDETKDDL